jgi:phytanoyl-CoA hydroxylase
MQMTGPGIPAHAPGLSPELVERYRNEGYLALGQVLTPAEVAEAKATLTELFHKIVNNDASLKEGKFWNSTESPDARRFFVQYEPGYRFDARSTVADLELKVRKLMWFTDQHPFFDSLVNSHPVIRPVVETLLGEQALLFQDMALVKPPFIGSEKPWHQDNAYFEVAPLTATIGVWIALDDATVENGCMHVLPGQHNLRPLAHYHGVDCQIVESNLDAGQVVPVEIASGGAMFFSGLLPHQTPPNASPLRRRALQFHFRAASSRIVSNEEYDRLFVDRDGTPASCKAASTRRKSAAGKL